MGRNDAATRRDSEVLYSSRFKRGHLFVQKFGSNNAVAGSEDVWTGGGTYPWPSTAEELEIGSTSANDTSNGTHARTVNVQGLDENWMLTSETVGSRNGRGWPSGFL